MGGEHSRRGTGGSYCSAARRARGDGRSCQRHGPGHGVEANEVAGIDRAGARAGVLLADAAGTRLRSTLRRP